MVSLSKLLDRGLRDAKCYDVFHRDRICNEFQFKGSLTSLIICMKYFTPVVGIPLIMKGRNIQKKHIWDTLSYYIELVTTGFISSQTIPIALCATRIISGRFNKYNIAYIPIAVSCWTVLFTSDRVARIFTSSMFQVALEAALINGRNPISLKIGQSKFLQTIVFMICSAFILSALQNEETKTLWIIKPISKSKQTSGKKCNHEESCLKFCLSDLRKTILIVPFLNLYKIFVRAKKDRNFRSAFKNKFLSLDFSTLLFLSSYSGIYRLTSCLLNRSCNPNFEFKHFVAAFLGGSSFYILPNLTVLCYGVTISIDIIWNLFKRHKFESDSRFINIVKQIPFHRLSLFVIAGNVGHIYLFRPHLLNPLGLGIVSALTGNKAIAIRKDLQKFVQSLDK